MNVTSLLMMSKQTIRSLICTCISCMVEEHKIELEISYFSSVKLQATIEFELVKEAHADYIHVHVYIYMVH